MGCLLSMCFKNQYLAMMYLLSVNPQTDLLGDKFTLILSKILKRFSLLANVVFRMCLKLTC